MCVCFRPTGAATKQVDAESWFRSSWQQESIIWFTVSGQYRCGTSFSVIAEKCLSFLIKFTRCRWIFYCWSSVRHKMCQYCYNKFSRSTDHEFFVGYTFSDYLSNDPNFLLFLIDASFLHILQSYSSLWFAALWTLQLIKFLNVTKILLLPVAWLTKLTHHSAFGRMLNVCISHRRRHVCMYVKCSRVGCSVMCVWKSVFVTVLLQAEPPVHGAHSSSAVNRLFQPNTGVGMGGPATQTAVGSMGPRYASTPSYTGPTGIEGSRMRSSEEMSCGYQQPGVSGHRPFASIGGQMDFDRPRSMNVANGRLSAVETGPQRSFAPQYWNNQRAPPVSSPFITIIVLWVLS